MKGKVDLATVGTAYKAPPTLESSPEEKLVERHIAHLEESSRWENFAAKVDLTQNYHFIHHRHNDLDWQYNIDRYSRYLWKHYETKKYQDDYSKGSKIFGSKSPSRYAEAFSEIPTPKYIPRSTSSSRYVLPPYATEGEENQNLTERKNSQGSRSARSRTPPSAKKDALGKSVLTGLRPDTSPGTKNIFGIDESKIPQKQRRTRDDRSRSDDESPGQVPNNSRTDDPRNPLYQNPKEFSSFQKGEYEKVLEERLKGFSESPGKSNGKSNEKLPSFSQSSSTTEKDRQSPNRNAPKPFNPENQPTEETTSSQEYENYTQAKLQEMKNIYSEAQQTVNTQNKQSKATMQNINASNKSKAFERYYNKMAYKTYVPYSDRKKAEAFKTPDKYAKKPTTTKESKISETIKKTYLENKDIPTEKKDYNQDKIEIQSTNEGIKVEERNDMLAPRRETFGGEIIQIEDFSVEKISSPKESQPKSPKDGTQKSSPKSQNNISVKPSPKSQQGAQEGQEFAKVSQFQENVNELHRLVEEDEESKFRSEFRDMLDKFGKFEDLYIKMKRTLPPNEATNKVIELSIAFVSAYCTLRGNNSRLNA